MSVGCLVFLVGTVLVTNLATTVPSANFVTIVFVVLTAGAVYLSYQGKISKAYGISLAAVCFVVVLKGLSLNFVERLNEEAERARIAEGAREEARLAALSANKDNNFAEGNRLLGAGDVDKALEYYRLVREVDPNYKGLDTEISKAQEAVKKQQEAQQRAANPSPTQGADALSQMQVVFRGHFSRNQIKQQLDKSMLLYGLPISEESYSTAGSVLVSMRQETGSREMDILDDMIRSHVPGVNVDFPEAAAISAAFLQAEPN